jgi:glyoxylase-like metal-dependent hydrolase (beta-lactamase superfamily II)
MKWLCGIVCGVAAAGAFAQSDTIFAYKVGAFEVYTLVENQGPGRPSILIGAEDALLRQYVPNGTFQSETNTFLIRGGGRNVLVDTGFGTTLFQSLKTLGVAPGDIDQVLITHMHGDHIGGLQKDGKPLFSKALVYVAKPEKDFWAEGNAAASLAPYGDRVKTFLPGQLGAQIQDLLPGITAIAAYGHTPGHTVFLVSSQNQRLLIWGDLMHVQDIQFPRPDISVTYDTDPKAAAEVRKQILDYAAQNRIPIAGMHLVYPAIGSVESQTRGGYRFVPAQ